MRLEDVDINKLIQDALLLHSEDLHVRNIVIRKRLSKLPNIRADHDKMKQVVINLILNARDAMPEGGELLVSSGVITNEPKGSDRVTLQFKDNGCGIPEDVLPHIFEPFFTTRADGVGLGLAVCKTIIEEHKGRISITSYHEKDDINGSVVTVEIPGLDKQKTVEKGNLFTYFHIK